MGKLEQLRQQVADMFENAEDKESIEKLAAINNTIDEVSKEQEDITSKNADLIKSYKDLIQHTSFKDDKKPVDTVTGVASLPSFEDALNQFMSKKN